MKKLKALYDRISTLVLNIWYLPVEVDPGTKRLPPEGWHNDLPPVEHWECICPDRRRGVHRIDCKAQHEEIKS